MLAVAVALGCSGPPGAGRALGTDLGTFGVAATLAANECGPGALGSPPTFAFGVELARADGELFWDGRGGTIGPELDFVFSASSSVELRPARGADPGCSIARADSITGVLDPDDSGVVTAFQGQLNFEFETAPESACTGEEQEQAGLPRLPCGMSYAIEGRRTRAPMP